MSGSWRNHPACPGGCNQLADECECRRPNPLGSMRVETGGDREALMRQLRANPTALPAKCNGLCFRASDVGVDVPGDPVAYPNLLCPEHWGEVQSNG